MKAWSKFLVATLVVAMVVAVAGCKPVSAQSGTVTHVVRQGETLYSISRAYGVSVSCWGLADPNRIYPGQVLTCGGGGDYYTEQTYQAPSQQQAYQQTYTTNVSGAVTHTVRRGETLYSISRAYGVSVSCWGLADPNRIYEGQVLTCGASSYTQQPYQAPAQQQVYAQPADAYVGNQVVTNVGMPNWLSQDIALGGTWWCVLRGGVWYISRSSTGSNMMTYDDTNHICSGYASTTQISGQVAQPAITPNTAQPVQQVSGTEWITAVSRVENRVFPTKQAAADWLAGVYNGASSAYKAFLETNGVNILIGTASMGGAIWLVKAAAGLSQGPLLTAAVVAFGVMVIFAIVEYVIAYIRR